MADVKTVAIIGNPNVGKTYLFNRLTACNGCVGNWAGVTSTACEAKACGDDQYRILDLPGCHHLSEGKKSDSTDGQVEVESYLGQKKVDLWLNVIDATNLQKQLYLTIQLLESGQRVICVINRIDLLAQFEKEIDIKALGGFLQMPIVKVSAKLGLGIRHLQSMIKSGLTSQHVVSAHQYPVNYHAVIEDLLCQHTQENETRWQAWQKLINDDSAAIAPAWHFDPKVAELLKCSGTLTDIMALTRYQVIDKWCQQVVLNKKSGRVDKDKVLDQWFLHRWLGLPIFFIMMFTVFWLSMGLGQLLQGVLEPLLQCLAIQIPTAISQYYQVPFYLEVLIVHGFGLSLVTALSFFPILLVMFFSLHLLEESGYMTRAAVVMDRIMRQLDLPGESMVALVLGLGCNVPGILATRHIPKKSDKIVTALMMPFMSCGARLTIFAVFSSVFFPNQSASVLFTLYVIGLSVAFATGLGARYLGLSGGNNQDNYLLEIPGYQWPSLTMGLQQAYQRTQRFVWRALGVITPVCITLALCNHISCSGELLLLPGDQSILAWLGKSLSIIFHPIGLRAEHWPLVVSLVMGLLAKEVVLTTLSVFYTQMSAQAVTAQPVTEIWNECLSEILNNLTHSYTYFLPSLHSDLPTWAPFLNSQHIATDAVMSYLIFTLLYFPCVSTLYATARQTSWRWAGVSVLWSTLVAYLCASGYLWLVRSMNTRRWELIYLAIVLCVGFILKEWLKKRIKAAQNDDRSAEQVTT